MPTAHVLVALSSVAFTCASGHTLRAIRERRDPAFSRRVREKRKANSSSEALATPTRNVKVNSSPEIEALRVMPSWHEAGSPEERVKQLGLDLDGRVAANPAGVFYPVVLVGDLAYVSGQVPRLNDGTLILGKCGTDDLTEDEAVEAARVVGLTMLATMRQQFGSLDNIKRVVKVNGFVNCADDFTQQPLVVNGLANLFIEVFGAAGKSSRSAVGCSGLPLGIPVEAEAIVELM
jgi:enamine deaminase RidA (YjgF/YER057c/UK114 family)